MRPAADAAGRMRWAHPDHGFEFALGQTLARLPAQFFDKADWEPVITAALAQAKDIRRVWDHGLGFGALNSLCEKILSSGAQPEKPRGLCIESMQHFFKESMKLEKELGKLRKEVQGELTKVEALVSKQNELERRAPVLSELIWSWAPRDDDERRLLLLSTGCDRKRRESSRP